VASVRARQLSHGSRCALPAGLERALSPNDFEGELCLSVWCVCGPIEQTQIGADGRPARGEP